MNKGPNRAGDRDNPIVTKCKGRCGCDDEKENERIQVLARPRALPADRSHRLRRRPQSLGLCRQRSAQSDRSVWAQGPGWRSGGSVWTVLLSVSLWLRVLAHRRGGLWLSRRLCRSEHVSDAGLVKAAALDGIAAADALKFSKVARELTLSRKLHDQATLHAEDAIRAGKPQALTIDRAGTAANRRASTSAIEKVPGKHLDEYWRLQRPRLVRMTRSRRTFRPTGDR